MKKGIDQFDAFAIKPDAMKSLKGGLCGCRERTSTERDPSLGFTG